MTTCAIHFITGVLKDAGVAPGHILLIEGKLFGVLATYNANRSQVTAADVAEEFYNCISEVLNDSTFVAQQIAYAIFFVLLFTAFLIMLIATVLYILKDSRQGGLMVSLWIIFIIFYMLVVTLVLFNTGLNIYNRVTIDTAIIRNCVNKAVAELNTLVETNENALSTALCSYPESPFDSVT